MTQQIRVLIVDDDFMVAKVHQAYTERVAGFEVVGMVHSGAEALASAGRLAPDLIVLDIYLPDMSGLQVLQELRARSMGVDVIMVTAARDVGSVQAAMAGGAFQYIVKPFDFARFSATLQTYRRFFVKRSLLVEVDQEDVDQLYATVGAAPDAGNLPKGLNRPTLALILRNFQQQPEPASAQELADRSGLSRATVRRYLEYLEAKGLATLELRYGAAGRPEHRYRLVQSGT